LVALASLAEPAFAETPPAPPASDAGTHAIQKGEQGLALYEQGKWSEALERFREAESLYHSPVFGLYTARALRNAGRLLEAREAFRALVAEKLEPSAPELWRQAQRDGVTELAALEMNIPTAIVTVRGGTQATALTIDGRPIAAGVSIELDPGTHHVVANDGARSATRDVTLAVGAREQRIVVKFPSPAARTPAPPPEKPRASSGPYVPGLVVAGIGGATLLAGGVVGILALNKKSDTRDNLPVTCVETTCPESREDEVEAEADKARNLGTAADVLFVTGGIVTAVGIGMLVFVPRDEPNVAVLASPRGGAVRVRF
jgi:hypothetical protein